MVTNHPCLTGEINSCDRSYETNGAMRSNGSPMVWMNSNAWSGKSTRATDATGCWPVRSNSAWQLGMQE